MKNNSKEKGITLIALVITIIVLLILAGVSIAAIGGNEDVMEKANEAKHNWDKSTAKDELELKVIDSIKKQNLNYNQDSIMEELSDECELYARSGNDLVITYKGYNFVLDEDCNVRDFNEDDYADKVKISLKDEDGTVLRYVYLDKVAQNYNLPLEGFTKDGYTLLGWGESNDSNAIHNKVRFGSSADPSDDIFKNNYDNFDLYAKWVKEDYCCLKLSYVSGHTYSITKNDGDNAGVHIVHPSVGSQITIAMEKTGYDLDITNILKGATMGITYNGVTLRGEGYGPKQNLEDVHYEVEATGDLVIGTQGGSYDLLITKDGEPVELVVCETERYGVSYYIIR